MGARAPEAEFLLGSGGGGASQSPGRAALGLGDGGVGAGQIPAWALGHVGAGSALTGDSGRLGQTGLGGCPQLLSKLLCDLGLVVCPLWAWFP